MKDNAPELRKNLDLSFTVYQHFRVAAERNISWLMLQQRH